MAGGVEGVHVWARGPALQTPGAGVHRRGDGLVRLRSRLLEAARHALVRR
jgi:hypothetical protein